MHGIRGVAVEVAWEEVGFGDGSGALWLMETGERVRAQGRCDQ
jgi:hypothetical protein